MSICEVIILTTFLEWLLINFEPPCCAQYYSTEQLFGHTVSSYIIKSCHVHYKDHVIVLLHYLT